MNGNKSEWKEKLMTSPDVSVFNFRIDILHFLEMKYFYEENANFDSLHLSEIFPELSIY